jgi:hypothetical protein
MNREIESMQCSNPPASEEELAERVDTILSQTKIIDLTIDTPPKSC